MLRREEVALCTSLLNCCMYEGIGCHLKKKVERDWSCLVESQRMAMNWSQRNKHKYLWIIIASKHLTFIVCRYIVKRHMEKWMNGWKKKNNRIFVTFDVHAWMLQEQPHIGQPLISLILEFETWFLHVDIKVSLKNLHRSLNGIL